MANRGLKVRYDQDIRLVGRRGGLVLLSFLVLGGGGLYVLYPAFAAVANRGQWAVAAFAYAILAALALRRYGRGVGVFAALILFAMSMPVLADPSVLGRLSLIYVYAIAGMGVFLLTGMSGQVSLGHGAFMACGAYVATLMQNNGSDMLMSVPMGMGASALFGFVVGLAALRLSVLHMSVISYAFAALFLHGLSQWTSVTGGEAGLRLTATPTFLGRAVETGASQYMFALSAVIVSVLICLNVQRSPTGRAFKAVREDERMARLVGVNLPLTRAVAFALSAALTGLAGAVYANHAILLEPDSFGLFLSVYLLAIVVVGGMGSVKGVFFGAVALAFLADVLAAGRQGVAALAGGLSLPPLSAVADGLTGPYSETVALGALLLLVVRFVPQGLEGVWRRLWAVAYTFPLYLHNVHEDEKAVAGSEAAEAQP